MRQDVQPFEEPSVQRLLAAIDQSATVDLLRELVRIPSVNPPGDVREAIAYCARELAAGFELHELADDPIKPNLIATRRFGDGPTLLWNAHVDVVPTGEVSTWSVPPFDAVRTDHRILGRGSCDDKASVTAQVIAALALQRSGIPLTGTLIVNVVADEEVGGEHGALLVARSGRVAPDVVIVGEPTDNRVCLGEKGSAGTRVTVYGRAAHGALPWEGVNAIEGMTQVISALQAQLWPALERRTHPLFRHSSATISLIEGGIKENLVPDRCSIYIDRRIVPGEDPAVCIAEIREIAERAVAAEPGLRVEAVSSGLGSRPATLTASDSLAARAMFEANRYLGLSLEPTGFNMATDGRHFAAEGFPTIIYGPGDPGRAHQPDEWIGIDELMQATRAYALSGLAVLHAR